MSCADQDIIIREYNRAETSFHRRKDFHRSIYYSRARYECEFLADRSAPKGALRSHRLNHPMLLQLSHGLITSPEGTRPLRNPLRFYEEVSRLRDLKRMISSPASKLCSLEKSAEISNAFVIVAIVRRAFRSRLRFYIYAS